MPQGGRAVALGVAVSLWLVSATGTARGESSSSTWYSDLRSLIEELIEAEVATGLATTISKNKEYAALCFYAQDTLGRMQSRNWSALPTALRTDFTRLAGDFVYFIEAEKPCEKPEAAECTITTVADAFLKRANEHFYVESPPQTDEHLCSASWWSEVKRPAIMRLECEDSQKSANSACRVSAAAIALLEGDMRRAERYFVDVLSRWLWRSGLLKRQFAEDLLLSTSPRELWQPLSSAAEDLPDLARLPDGCEAGSIEDLLETAMAGESHLLEQAIACSALSKELANALASLKIYLRNTGTQKRWPIELEYVKTWLSGGFYARDLFRLSPGRRELLETQIRDIADEILEPDTPAARRAKLKEERDDKEALLDAGTVGLKDFEKTDTKACPDANRRVGLLVTSRELTVFEANLYLTSNWQLIDCSNGARNQVSRLVDLIEKVGQLRKRFLSLRQQIVNATSCSEDDLRDCLASFKDRQVHLSAFVEAVATLRFLNPDRSLGAHAFRDLLLAGVRARMAIAQCDSKKGEPCPDLARMEGALGSPVAGVLVRVLDEGDLRRMAIEFVSDSFKETDDDVPRRKYLRFFRDVSIYLLEAEPADGDVSSLSKEAFRAAAIDLLRTLQGGGYPLFRPHWQGSFVGWCRKCKIPQHKATFSASSWRWFRRFVVPQLGVRYSVNSSYLNESGRNNVRYVVTAPMLHVAQVPFGDGIGMQVSLVDPLAPINEIALRKDGVDYCDKEEVAWDMLRPRVDLWLGLPQVTRKVAVMMGASFRFVRLRKLAPVDETERYKYDVDAWDPGLEVSIGLGLFL